MLNISKKNLNFAEMKLEKLKYGLTISSLRAIAMLPLGALYAASDAISFVLHRVIGYRRDVVRKNLRNSFPDKSDKELRRIEREFYRHLCDTIVETVKLLHISDSEIKKRVSVKGESAVFEALKGQHPVILYLGHFGNWEWVPAMRMVLNEPEIMGALYKPLHNKVADCVTQKIRDRLDIVHIPHNSAYRRLLEMRGASASFMIGFIADQRPLGGNLKHWTTFMGQPTPFMAGAETIGSRVNAHYLYVASEKTRRGHYVLNFQKIEVDPDDKDEFPYTRQFYRLLEESIRKQPEYWLWSHNRWKANLVNSD